MLAIALALAASLAYGVSDFLGGRKSRSVPLLGVLLVSQAAALVLACGVVLAFGGAPPGGDFLLYAALAGLCETVGVAALYRGLAVGVMSIVAPIAATAPMVSVAVALALGELPGPIQGVGIALALAGIALTSWTRPSGDRSGSRVASSVILGSLAAIGFGVFYVAIDAASEGSVPWALLIARLAAVTMFIAASAVRRAPLAVRRAGVPGIALIGALIVTADTLYAIASTKGLLSVVVVLSSLYPLATMGLARVYLHERLDRLQLLGVATCLCGVVAISAA